MKLLKRLGRLFQGKKNNITQTKDAEVERHRSENALVEIELRDK